LTQVEALGDLLNAETQMQKQQALHQLDGHLGDLYRVWRAELVQSLAYLEAVIDFAEDEQDVGEESILKDVMPRVRGVAASVETHLSDNHRGELVREGARVVVAGPPNVGKSTLLNLLSKRDVAIVSDIPGTTRDALEVHVDVRGLAVVLTDTAGLRTDTSDVVEQEGIKRTQRHLEKADVKVLMVDPEEYAWVERQEVDEKTIVVLSKADTVDMAQARALQGALARMVAAKLASSSLGSTPNALRELEPLAISCADGSNIHELLDAIKAKALGAEASSNTHATLLTRHRHRVCLLECEEYLRAFQDNAQSPYFDLVLGAEQLRQAAVHLGRITGHVDVEELLDVIFSDFCIGK
jgi:tRNA modification GTPase